MHTRVQAFCAELANYATKASVFGCIWSYLGLVRHIWLYLVEILNTRVPAPCAELADCAVAAVKLISSVQRWASRTLASLLLSCELW